MKEVKRLLKRTYLPDNSLFQKGQQNEVLYDEPERDLCGGNKGI